MPAGEQRGQSEGSVHEYVAPLTGDARGAHAQLRHTARRRVHLVQRGAAEIRRGG